jgi:hypothetical protein
MRRDPHELIGPAADRALEHDGTRHGVILEVEGPLHLDDWTLDKIGH